MRERELHLRALAEAHLALLVDERSDGFHELVLRIVPVVLQDSL